MLRLASKLPVRFPILVTGYRELLFSHVLFLSTFRLYISIMTTNHLKTVVQSPPYTPSILTYCSYNELITLKAFRESLQYNVGQHWNVSVYLVFCRFTYVLSHIGLLLQF